MATLSPRPGSEASVQAHPPEGRKRRRLPRASRACETCRARKTRCDQQMPCSNCSYYDLECQYSTPATSTTKPKENRSVAACAKSLTSQPSRPSPRGRKGGERLQSTPPMSESSIRFSDPIMSPPIISPVNTQSQTHNTIVSAATDQMDMEHFGSGLIRELDIRPMQEELLIKGTDGEISGLGGVNSHTQGTEFYGGSSNLAFLNTLFARARARARSCSKEPSTSVRDDDSTHLDEDSPGHLSNNHLSIVNLMYNADYNTSSNQQLESSVRLSNDHGENPNPPSPTTASSISLEMTPTKMHIFNRNIEKYCIDSYFKNKHFIHPFLDENSFRDRCSQLWALDASIPRPRRALTIQPLYYAVIAVGAINAPMNEWSDLNKEPRISSSGYQIQTTLQYANRYFDLAHQALGNTFEISTLETCQALFLLTVFCQNALKPHSSYLYSGMAVRTAIAIGLTNETYGNTPGVTREARRTWWCIYSHEVEMCCSSGRVDGLKDPRHYFTPLPSWNASDLSTSESSNPELTIIPAMVDLAQILRSASHDIYHDVSNRSLQRKSQISFKLDSDLNAWKKQLPNFLDLESFALDDAEWAFKQKLVLKFRSYNTRILIHRPFLVASSVSYDSSEFSRHVEICLDASRATIRVIHESMAHRPYLRTWWYCTTYALYATMIVLHLILLDFPKVPGEELVEDVEKSLEIFRVMGKNVTVAKRCGELTQEILGVAKRYLGDRKSKSLPADFATKTLSSDLGTEIFGQSFPNINEIWDDEALLALLNQDEAGPSRANALANFLDPSVIQGFVTGEVYY